MTLKAVARQFYLKGHFVPQELGMKLLEMGKDMKIKHSDNKVWGNFFRKKALHEGTNFFLQIYRGLFYMGT